MPVATYVSVPTTIDAIQWTGDNTAEIMAWTGRDNFTSTHPDDRGDDPDSTAALRVAANGNTWLPLATGEWIAKDSEGFYPIKDVVFLRKYRAQEHEGPYHIINNDTGKFFGPFSTDLDAAMARGMNPDPGWAKGTNMDKERFDAWLAVKR